MFGLFFFVFFVGIFDDGDVVGEFECGFEGICQVCGDVGLYYDVVYYYVDVVFEFFVEGRGFVDGVVFVVDF